MPSWKKLIVSGSDANLNSLYVNTAVTASTLRITGNAEFLGDVNILGSIINSSVVYASGSTTFGDTTSDTHSFTGSILVTGSIRTPLLSASYIDLDLLSGSNVPAHRPGRLFFGSQNGALEVYNEEADISLQVGQEFWVRVVNSTGDSIPSGTPVIISGSQENRPNIYPALSENNTSNPVPGNLVAGITTHTVEASTEGYITVQGVVRNINTTAFSTGDTLYLQTGSVGLRNTPPPFPFDIVEVGTVIKSATSGSIYVDLKKPTHFYNISGLSGSYNTTVGNIWVYQSNGAWTPSNILPAIVATGSFTGSFEGDGSRLVNVPGLFLKTGSYYSTTNDLKVTGSLFNKGQISTEVFSFPKTITSLINTPENSFIFLPEGYAISGSLSIGSNSNVIFLPTESPIATLADSTFKQTGSYYSTTNDLKVTGSVTATSFVGDGSGLTNLPSIGGIFTQTGSYYSTTNDLKVTGSVTATSFVGDGSGLTNLPSIGGIFTQTGSYYSTTNDLKVTGSVTATSFVGDGSGLTNLPSVFTQTGSYYSTTNDLKVTGSVTATSFVGDGSGLTNLPSVFTQTGSYYSTTNNLQVTGSVTATSFVGDGSGLTNLPSAGGIFTQTGSYYSTTNDLKVTGSVTVTSLQVNGTSDFNGLVDIYKSGSLVVNVEGSSGQLFSITDSLSGSLMSVNDVSGLPILEVFSDDRVIMGSFGAPAITVVGSTAYVSGSFTGSLTGTASTGSNITPAIASSGVNRVLTDDGDGTLTAESNLTFNGSVFDVNANSIITGSLVVTNGITGSLLGTATTASYVSFAGVDGLTSFSSSVSTRVTDLETASGSFSTRVTANESGIASLTTATSSYLLNTTDTLTGDLTVTGKITAQEFHTEFVSASIVFQSGSSKFGDTFDDTHSFTGSVDITGSLSVNNYTLPLTDGTANQIMFTDGAGTIAFDFLRDLYVEVKNISTATLPKGTPVHVSGSTGNTNLVIAASASDATTMPATFILNEELTPDQEGLGIAIGFINGVNTSGFTEGDVVYVGESGGYTNIKPTGSNLIQNLGIVTKVDASNGSGYVLGAGRTNAVPNLLNGEIFFGENNTAVQKSLSTVLSSSAYVYSGSFSGTLEGDISLNGTLQLSQSLLQYGSNTDVDTGTETVLSVNTGSYNSAFFDYVIVKGANARAGTVFSVWTGTSVEYAETSTQDIGDTSGVILSSSLDGANIRLQATTNSNDWSIRSLVRMI